MNYAKIMDTRSAIVHALTEWDRNQSPRKYHNPHFLGIALGALDNWEDGCDAREFVLDHFVGRLVPFILARCGMEPLSDAEYRRIR